MYCPKCATQNNEDAKFCRACGANLALVPQALTGRLPSRRSERRRHRGHGYEFECPPSMHDAITKIFMGIGFVLVSACVLFFAPAGRIWWFWMLIPAFAMLGKGVAELASLRFGQGLSAKDTQGLAQQQPQPREIPPQSDSY